MADTAQMATDPVVSLVDDAQLLSPAQMAQALADLTRDGSIKADYYGNGGAVAAFEAKIARQLGKQRAVMFATGTLANLMAIRCLAGPAPARILVHRDSHFFNDSGDNLAAVGGYTMVPLAGDGADDGAGFGAGFGADAVAAEIARAADARVASRIGAIAIESPSRRLAGRRFGVDNIRAISELARANRIPMLLDGARMLIECAFSGQTPAQMAAPFDLVYVSLYKYLDAPFGCVLAGRSAMLDQLYHDRRRHGGGLYRMWPAAVLADAALDRQAALWPRIIAHGDAVLDRLDRSPQISVERFSDGTNAVRLEIDGAPPDPDRMRAKAADLGLRLPAPQDRSLIVKINASWLSRDPQTLSEQIAASVGATSPAD